MNQGVSTKAIIVGSLLFVFVLISLFSCAGEAHAAVSFVQAASSNPKNLSAIGHAGTSTATLANTTAGDFIIVQTFNVEDGGNTPATGTVTDTQGNTFVLATATPNPGFGHDSSFLYYATNIVGGPENIYYYIPANGYYASVDVAEYSGVNNSSPLDGIALSKPACITSFSTANLTTNFSTDAVYITFAHYDNTSSTVSAGWTSRYNNYSATGEGARIILDQFPGTQGTFSNTFSNLGSCDGGIAYTVGLEAASSGGGGGDGTSPATPTGLAVTGTTTSTISLSWSASTDPDNTQGQISYNVYRNGTKITTTGAGVTTYSDSGLVASTNYSYAVSASDPALNTSSQSASVNGTTQAISSGDITPPTVNITSPANNATVSGTVTIQGTASDNVSVASVQVSIDGGSYQSVSGATSWSYTWDTTGVPNGTHTLTAKATDSSGNVANSGTITVTVNNAGGGTGHIWAVKQAGGGDFTTIQACATAMAPGDTCVVYAGTYNENVNVPAGTAGNYKTLTVNGSDVVTVYSFTLNSHTKLIGNCGTPSASGSCGFNLTNPSAPSSHACVAIPNNQTDIYIKNNVMYACGSAAMIAAPYPENVSYVYVQGNTLSYACITQAQAGTATKECNGILLEGDHVLVENNDVSHYTLGLYMNTSHSVFRNNTMHDQYETEAGGNSHTDWWFSEPGVPTTVQYNLIEGNLQYNGVGPNSKGILAQGDTSCGGECFDIIERFNVSSRIGSGYNSNNGSADWPRIQIYNNTIVDAGSNAGTLMYGDADNSEKSSNDSFLNQLYYFTQPTLTAFNVYSCGTSCNAGHSLYYCTGTCTQVDSHLYGIGNWTDDPGNKVANPLFVSYISAGNPSNNYHLSPGSPAIGAGTYLTTVASGDSGSGTSLVVDDASYFQDGYGLQSAGVQPDWIAVGSPSNVVQIVSINYANNVITLASPIGRSAGQGIYLYRNSTGQQVLFGTAPDMGAFAYNPGSSGGGSLPVITSSLSASATAGSPFSYQIVASNAPASYNATSLPTGLSVNTSTGLISGSPTTAATNNVTVSATNSGGTGSATLVLVVTAATPSDITPPSVPAGLTVTGTTTSTISLSWTPSTDPDSSVSGYQVFRGGYLAGTVTSPSFTDTGLLASTTYSYTVDAYDPTGNTSADSAAIQAATLPNSAAAPPSPTSNAGSGGGGSSGSSGNAASSGGGSNSGNAGSNSGGGSSGGGGGSYVPSAPSGSSSNASGGQSSPQSLLQMLLVELRALIAKLNHLIATSFTRKLTMGSTGSDVQNLQMFLNDSGYPVAQTGSGSLGNESTYFGSKTAHALMKFQAANGLPATGVLDAATRELVQGKF